MDKWNNKFRDQVASCWLFILSYKCYVRSSQITVHTHQKDQSYNSVQGDVAVYCMRHTEHVNTLRWQNAGFLMLEQVVRIVTTELIACSVCMFEDAVGNAH